MNLEKKLVAWREAGIVTAEQIAAIRAHEEKHSGNAKVWIVAGLGAVGGLAVAAGIISLIAANWSDIPVSVKLLFAGSIVAGTLVAALRLSRDGRTLASDLFLFGHGLLVLAMVGLVGQIYNLGGGPWRAFVLCGVLAVPAAVISTRSLLSDLPIAYGLVALGLWLESSRAFRDELRGFGFGLFVASLGGALLLGSDLLARVHAAAASALRRWGAALAVTPVLAGVFLLSAGVAEKTPRTFLTAASVVGALLAVRLAVTTRVAALSGTVFVFLLLLSTTLWGSRHAAAGPRFLAFAFFCAAAASFAMAAAQAGSKRLTNVFTLAIAARIVVLFLELIRTLALTGVGLLLTGLVLSGVAWAWWRLHGLVTVRPQPPASTGEAA